MRLRQRTRTGLLVASILSALVVSQFGAGRQVAMAADGVGPTVSGLSAPTGGVWLGTHWWQPDGGLGFCRVDIAADGTGSLNTSTCDRNAKAPGQAVVETAINADGTRYVYVPDLSSKSQGVWRLTWDPRTETIRGATILANSGMPGLRASSLALDPNGNLYVAFIKSDDIMRITNPARDRNLQTATRVAKTSDGGGVTAGLAMIRHEPTAAGRVAGDLYIAEETGITVVADVAACPANSVCGTYPSPIKVATPGAITSDGRRYVYTAESPLNGDAAIVRYDVLNHVQEVYSLSHPAILTPDGRSQSRYRGVSGLGLSANGDLYVGDDYTYGNTAGTGHLWKILSGAGPDVSGSPGAPAQVPPPASQTTARLRAWGLTAPDGGVVWLPGSLGGHWWVSDHAQGFCRMDSVPGTSLLAINTDVCDDMTMGSPGQAVYDPRPNTGIAGVPDGTHFVYVTQNDHASPGLWRFVFDPATETVAPRPVLMAPGAALDGLSLNAAALGPDGHLYVAGFKDGRIRRINNPQGDPKYQTVSVVGVTLDGRGINGTMAFLGNDLYLPENEAITVITGAAGCPRVITPESSTAPAVTEPCNTTALPVTVVFGAGVATDPARGYVYISDAPGAAPATILRFNPSNRTSTVYATRGNLPAAGTPDASVFCSLTCMRTAVSQPASGTTSTLHYAMGLAVNADTGTLVVTDDPIAGGRAGRGHLWEIPLAP